MRLGGISSCTKKDLKHCQGGPDRRLNGGALRGGAAGCGWYGQFGGLAVEQWRAWWSWTVPERALVAGVGSKCHWTRPTFFDVDMLLHIRPFLHFFFFVFFVFLFLSSTSSFSYFVYICPLTHALTHLVSLSSLSLSLSLSLINLSSNSGILAAQAAQPTSCHTGVALWTSTNASCPPGLAMKKKKE